ncbi:YrzE family protein [Microbacterium sp. CPCC 204701]|uniref:YrzE family protein n=1 Tax=Microbacterium sp. CPCC 204701 TaxID=2493084 RepID=UPI000FD95BA3|nr:YrzE family protein [Microbacterium sp. CPCC 204701]
MSTDHTSDEPAGRRADPPTVRYDADGDAVADDRHVVAGERTVADDRPTLREDVVQREHERFGGFKFGSAFLGWLTAMGALLLLTAVVAAVGAALGLTAPESMEDAAEAANENMGAATIIGTIAVAVVLFLAYFAGGYVAGRMARFSGAKQGLAVWLWAVVFAVIVAILTAVAGSQWDILGSLDGFPRIPVTPETATATGILTALGAAIVTLAAAVLGGMAGMRYHRRVDRVGLGE